MLLATGDTIIKFFRVQDGAFKPVNPNLSKREPQNYLAHAWLPDDQVVVTTDDAQILLFENAELRTQWTTGEDGGVVNCIAVYSKGFICGGEGGIVRVFEKSEDGREPFKRSQLWRLTTIGIPSTAWPSIYPARKFSPND